MSSDAHDRSGIHGAPGSARSLIPNAMSGSVVIGDERALGWCVPPPVEPLRRGQGEQPLPGADEYPGQVRPQWRSKLSWSSRVAVIASTHCRIRPTIRTGPADRCRPAAPATHPSGRPAARIPGRDTLLSARMIVPADSARWRRHPPAAPPRPPARRGWAVRHEVIAFRQGAVNRYRFKPQDQRLWCGCGVATVISVAGMSPQRQTLDGMTGD